jgi:hypothetical protein
MLVFKDKVVRAIVEADRSWQAAGYGDDKSSSGKSVPTKRSYILAEMKLSPVLF